MFEATTAQKPAQRSTRRKRVHFTWIVIRYHGLVLGAHSHATCALKAQKNPQVIELITSFRRREVTMAERGYQHDLPCSSSLDEGELPSSQELLPFPLDGKLLPGLLLTECLPRLFPEISVVLFSNIAGMLGKTFFAARTHARAPC